MNAGEEWDAIQADPEFQAQPETTKNRVALSFFEKRIAPQVPKEQHETVRHQFFADAFKAPTAAPEPGKLALAKQAVGETLKGDVPVLAPVAEALRNGIPGAIAEAGGRVGLPTAGAALGTAVGTLGELVPKTGGELAVAGLGGPALEGLGAVGAKAAPTVVSKLTGRSLPEATRAIKRAKELMNPVLLKPETIDNATQALGDSIKGARSALGRRLGVVEADAAAKVPGRVLPVDQIGDELATNLQKVGYSVDGKAQGDIPKRVPPELQEIVDKFRNFASQGLLGPDGNPLPKIPRPLSLQDALQLKKDIYGMVSYDKSKLLGLGDAESTFLKDAAKNLDDHIRAIGGDELNAATDKFSRMAKSYDRLSKNAMSGKTDTVQKRLGKIFAAGDAERKIIDPLADVGAGQKALDTVLDAKTAQGFRPVISPYVERAAKHTGGGVLGAAGAVGGVVAKSLIGGPKALALGATALGATSPRLNNALIRATMVPIGESAAVDALAAPASRAVVANPVMRRLQKKEKK